MTNNFVGAPGYVWPFPNEFPSAIAFGLRLQQFGYIINPAAPNWSIVSPGSRSIVRDFQRDYNDVRTELGISPTPPAVANDGLIGARTINALRVAREWSLFLGQGWPDVVATYA